MRKYRVYTAMACAALVVGMAGCGAGAAAQTTAAESRAETTAQESESTTVVEEVTGAIESMEDESQASAEQERICVSGPVTAVGEDSLTIDNQSGASSAGEMVLNVNLDTTYLLDGESGLPVELSSIAVGDTVYAYIGPAMTMSLPPITNAELIFTNVPADMRAPLYVEIRSLITDGSTGVATLTASDGAKYQLAEDCTIIPYLTRNLVTMDDLSRGRTCVVWADKDNIATKIMLFAE